jgi:Family of unknown function (DUF6232)
MSRDFTKLEITPKLLDFGSSVVSVAQITRVGVFIERPLRLVGLVFLLGAAALLGREIFQMQGVYEFPAHGSVMLWTACALAGIGIFGVSYARRRLLIATCDGARLVLSVNDSKFAVSVVTAIRDAIAADSFSPMRIQVDFKSRSIDRPASAERSSASSHRESVRPSKAAEEWLARQSKDAPVTSLLSDIQRPLGERTSAPLNGGARVTSPATSRLDPIEQRLEALAGSAPLVDGATAADKAARNGSTRSTLNAKRVSANGSSDLAELIRHVGAAELQHKQALLDLLRVVEDYEKGGPISRDDATAHWRSFSDYVQQYLGSVDGLPDLTRRAGRSIGLGGTGAAP